MTMKDLCFWEYNGIGCGKYHHFTDYNEIGCGKDEKEYQVHLLNIPSSGLVMKISSVVWWWWISSDEGDDGNGDDGGDDGDGGDGDEDSEAGNLVSNMPEEHFPRNLF